MGAAEQVQVGDTALSSVSELSGTVLTVRKDTVKLHVRVRFAPGGSWYDQEHKVPRSSLLILIRGTTLLADDRSEEQKRRRPLTQAMVDAVKVTHRV